MIETPSSSCRTATLSVRETARCRMYPSARSWGDRQREAPRAQKAGGGERTRSALRNSSLKQVRSVRRPGRQGNSRIGEGRVLAPVRPGMQAAGLQSPKLHLAAAFPDPQTRAIPVHPLPDEVGTNWVFTESSNL